MTDASRLAVAVATFVLASAIPAPRALAKGSPCADAAAWQQLILTHQARYPAMGVPDVLKLLQQAALGSEHAVGNPDEAAAWMTREWATLDSGPPEPLVDTLGATSGFARIHLRPFRAAGGNPSVLVAAFVETAHRVPLDTAKLACALGAFVAAARAHQVRWPADSVSAQTHAWARQGYPAVEHTALFESRYRPAYRVVALSLVPELIGRRR